MADKPIPLIEYQEIQRTPQEALDYLQEELDAGKITHMVVIYHGGKVSGYATASENRDYTKAGMLWDIIQWFRWWFAIEDE